jgi:hypothetical protein
LALLSGGACQKHDNPVGPGSNRAPEVRNVTVSPPTVGPGGSATIRVEAVDPEGDALFYRYSAEAGSVTPNPGQPAQATYTNTASPGRGTDRVTVFVTDSKNATGTYTASIGLLGNQPPRVRIEAGRSGCHPGRPGDFCTIALTALAEDTEGDVLDYVWAGCASGVLRQAECRVRAIGPTTAVVSVTDARGATSLASVTVQGENRAPNVVRDGPESRPSPARLVITPEDPDDGSDYRCGWRGDCTCRGDFQSYNTTCEVATGASTCNMTVYCWDGWGATGEARFRLQK